MTLPYTEPFFPVKSCPLLGRQTGGKVVVSTLLPKDKLSGACFMKTMAHSLKVSFRHNSGYRTAPVSKSIHLNIQWDGLNTRSTWFFLKAYLYFNKH